MGYRDTKVAIRIRDSKVYLALIWSRTYMMEDEAETISAMSKFQNPQTVTKVSTS